MAGSLLATAPGTITAPERRSHRGRTVAAAVAVALTGIVMIAGCGSASTTSASSSAIGDAAAPEAAPNQGLVGGGQAVASSSAASSAAGSSGAAAATAPSTSRPWTTGRSSGPQICRCCW